MRKWTAGLGLLALCAAPRAADAFLLVTKTKGESSDEPTVVALREGRHTVLTLRIRHLGAADDAAILVPVPAGAAVVKAGAPPPLEGLGQLTRPRVAEYWELDPCEFHPALPPTPDVTQTPPPSTPAPPAATASGEYEVQILEGKSGAEVVAALKKDGFTVPEKAEPVLDAYLKGGKKLLVARIAGAKLKSENGAVDLPPLTVQYPEEELTLPVRLLGLTGGRRELSAFVVGANTRFEAANQPNLAVPTNLDVSGGIREKLDPFYGALLDRAFEKDGTAVVTEYAWRASTCESCPAPLSTQDVAALGSAVLPSAAEGKQHEVMIEAPGVSTRPGGPDEVRASVTECYRKALATRPALAGEVVVDVEVGGAGEITSATAKGTADEALQRCATDGVKAGKFDKTGAKGAVTIQFAPLSRKFFGDLVLTRLRARYAAVAERDLVLRPARAIEGGREDGPDGVAEKKVYVADSGNNNFQPRYVIRHPWKGAVKCENPERGSWGAKPKNFPTEPASSSDPDAGKAPELDAGKGDGGKNKKPKGDAGPPAGRDGVTVESLVVGELPEMSSYAIAFAQEAPPGPAPTPVVPTAPAIPTAPPDPLPPATSDGCGCRTAPTPGLSPELGIAGLLGLVALGVRRRRRRSS